MDNDDKIKRDISCIFASYTYRITSGMPINKTIALYMTFIQDISDSYHKIEIKMPLVEYQNELNQATKTSCQILKCITISRKKIYKKQFCK